MHIFCPKTSFFITNWFPSPLRHCVATESPKDKPNGQKADPMFLQSDLESFSSVWLGPENLKKKKGLKSTKFVCIRKRTKCAEVNSCEQTWCVLGRDIWAWLKQRMMTTLEATEICGAKSKMLCIPKHCQWEYKPGYSLVCHLEIISSLLNWIFSLTQQFPI